MKATGPTKKSTRRLIVGLEKMGKKSKQGLWFTLAETLGKPRRMAKQVNLWKLSQMGKVYKNAVFVVPGKVLSAGEVEGKLDVAAFAFSKGAMDKIRAAKGRAMTLEELLETKPKASECVVVV